GPARTFLRFSPDGSRLAASQPADSVEVWDVLDPMPHLLWTHRVERVLPWLAWDPSGSRLLATGEDGRGVRVLNGADGVMGKVFNSHTPFPLQFEFHPRGRLVASV